MFLYLSGQIEGQLREAYDRAFKAGLATQSSIAKKLKIHRSAVHHRLMGHTNMTIETIADMVWALNQAIKVEIFDPENTRHHGNYFFDSLDNSDKQSVLSANPLKGSPVVSTLPPEIKGLLKASTPAAAV
jgi:hypothetical protein